MGLDVDAFAHAISDVFSSHPAEARVVFSGVALGIAVERAWSAKKDEIANEFARELDNFGGDDEAGVA
jgi:hypothetical protein